MIPGEYMIENEYVTLNSGRGKTVLKVANTGDRPVQVGSHYHFFEVNKCLDFPREQAFGRRLNIPSGTAVRFEPGEEKEVELVAVGGNALVHGLNGLTGGGVHDPEIRKNGLTRAKGLGFKGVEDK